MNKGPSTAVIAAWAALVRAERTILSGVAAELKAAGLLSTSEYDTLLELDRAGEAGLRPGELQKRLGLAQYRISRLVDGLHKAGYARRRPCPEDGRGAVVTITAEGHGLVRSMWPAYAEAIGRHLGSRLDAAQASELARLLGTLTREVDHGP